MIQKRLFWSIWRLVSYHLVKWVPFSNVLFICRSHEAMNWACGSFVIIWKYIFCNNSLGTQVKMKFVFTSMIYTHLAAGYSPPPTNLMLVRFGYSDGFEWHEIGSRYSIDHVWNKLQVPLNYLQPHLTGTILITTTLECALIDVYM